MGLERRGLWNFGGESVSGNIECPGQISEQPDLDELTLSRLLNQVISRAPYYVLPWNTSKFLLTLFSKSEVFVTLKYWLFTQVSWTLHCPSVHMVVDSLSFYFLMPQSTTCDKTAIACFTSIELCFESAYLQWVREVGVWWMCHLTY